MASIKNKISSSPKRKPLLDLVFTPRSLIPVVRLFMMVQGLAPHHLKQDVARNHIGDKVGERRTQASMGATAIGRG